jgi:heavy metal efflux system protein
MPPNTSDTLIMLKPREEWPDPALTKDALQRQIEEAVGALAGNTYEFSQPIAISAFLYSSPTTPLSER